MNSDSSASLLLAINYVKEGNFTLAVEKYFAYFLDTPKTLWDAEHVKEFIKLICDMKVFITLQDVSEEIWNTISNARVLFPDDWKLLNVSADIYFQYACNDKFAENAFRAFQVAQKNNVSCLAVEKKLLKVMWNEVPRWHFRMLNGKVRNGSYRTAICKALDEGFTTALDIGAGCGLLSLYLGTHPSKPKVTMFESNKTLYDLTLTNLEKYCPEITQDGYSSNSNDITETKFKSNLLVTEIFDVAVFGEGILGTLLHSLKSHMNTSNYRIIPAKVNVFVTGITCKNLDRKFRLHNKLPSLQIDDNINIVRNSEDPYDAENILSEKFDILTETAQVMELDFHKKEILETIYKNEWNKNVTLKGLKNGLIDCFVVWFDLHLDDEIVISTNPFHNLNEPCWEQAIFHCPSPLKIKNNEELSISVNIIDEHLHFESLNQNLQCEKSFHLGEHSLSFLNDEKWIEYLVSVSEMVTKKDPLTIIDFSSFPIIGLLLAKKGHHVIHVFKHQQDEQFIEYLIRKNNIEPSSFNSVHSELFPACVLGQSEIGYVFYEPCDSDGTLNSSPLDNIIFKKFSPKSFFIDIIVHFELIFSPYLDHCNRVSRENVEPFEELARSINIFSGTEHPYLPHDFPHEIMTDEQNWNMQQNSQSILPLNVSKDGKINGILTWFTLVGLGGIEYSTKQSTYFNLNVILLSEGKVEKNQCINIRCQYEEGGFIKLQICEQESRTDIKTANMHSNSIKTFYNTYCNNYLESDHDPDTNDSE